MELNDDFERFCEIAQRSPRNSLSPSYQSPEPYMGRRSTQCGYMPDEEEMQVRRSSSFREPRRTSYTPHKRRSGNISSTRSPIRFDYQLSPGSRGESGALSATQRSAHGLNVDFADRRNELPEEPQAEFIEQRDADNHDSPRFRPSPRLNATNRHRAGSMKEMGRKNPKTYYRPSAPAVFSDTLSPTYGNEQIHSPGRYSNNSTEDNLVRVRRFQRKKDGQVISKGDRKIHQSELYSSTANAYDVKCISSVYPSHLSAGTNPAIYTHEASDRSDTSDSDNEVVEIPAITTTLVNQPLHHGSARTIQSSALHSPNALRADTRNRSRSWAFVNEPQGISPIQARSPARVDTFPSQPLTVQVLGSSRVGKTSLCMQFQTSESLDVTLECAQEDELTRNITVEVNNEKFNLIMIDTNLTNDDFQSSSDSDIIESADAYVVVYAIDDKATFLTARAIVNYLLAKCKRSSAILLAANKSDLVRTRAVSQEDGKNLAAIYSCRFYEISTSLNHRVDELLVGIVTEIQERRLEVDKERDRLERMASTHNKRGSISNPGHRRSLVGQHSTTNSVVKFFQKHFHRKEKTAHNLL